jgi:hypothetical protein
MTINTEMNKNKLIVKGQGVFQFTNNYVDPCIITFYNENKTDGLKFQFTPLHIIVIRIINSTILIDPNNVNGLSNISGAYYWISIDSKIQRIYAGIGETRIENVLYEYQWKSEDDNIKKDNKLFLESLYNIDIFSSIIPISVLRYPITKNVPMYVLDKDIISIDDVASGLYIPNSNLDSINKKLYDCISGKKFVLDDDNFPDFSKAIEYSIKTPGLWCHDKLAQKATRFNKDNPNLLETYLRITLGQNNADSPDIPYVIEIWPVGHYSPIHSHGGAYSIIRVLHGSINVSLFPFLSDKNCELEPCKTIDFNKDDITWISPSLNQIHQVRNLKDNCEISITIQIYMNNLENKSENYHIDYIDSLGNIQKYEPDSDMDFVNFKKLIKYEWLNKNK